MKRPDRCLNCDHPLDGDFCSQCGQKSTDLNVPLRELMSEVLGEVTAFDSRMLRTVKPFLTRPGLLTVEYNAGRRVRYVPPLRLYVFFSFVAFLTLALTGVRVVRVNVTPPGQDPITLGRRESEPATPGEETAADERQAPAGPGDPGEKTGGGKTRSLFQKLNVMMQEDPERVNEIFIQRFAQVLFVFVPIFALLLKLLYVRHRILYIRHLTFSAYHHAFVFFVMWIVLLLSLAGFPESWKDALGIVAFAVLTIYSFLSLRRVYAQSRVMTLLKMTVLGGSYMVLLLGGLLATLLISALSL